MRVWLGDSRGRWEGDTLVVETTNFTDKSSFSGSIIARGGSTATMHLVERFIGAADDTLLYEHGVRDFEKYRVDPATDLAPDFFVPDAMPPPPGVSLGARKR